MIVVVFIVLFVVYYILIAKVFKNLVARFMILMGANAFGVDVKKRAKVYSIISFILALLTCLIFA